MSDAQNMNADGPQTDNGPEIDPSIWPDEKPKEEVKEEIHLKTRPLPALIMLIGGSVTVILCFIKHYEILHSLKLILCSLVVFLILGAVIREFLNNIVIERREDEETHSSRDAVIERTDKEAPPEGEQ